LIHFELLEQIDLIKAELVKKQQQQEKLMQWQLEREAIEVEFEEIKLTDI